MSGNYDQGATKNKHFKALRVKKVVRVSEGGRGGGGGDPTRTCS